jgi:hypothetical protein
VNLYSIILGLVVLGGIGISIWGWHSLARLRRIRQWPSVRGTIEESVPGAEANDLLPHIVFSYFVDNTAHRRLFDFPEGTHPLPEFTQTYLKRYPVGTQVNVYYDPQHPEIATLEPGAQGDWMILALGILMTVGGALALMVTR